MIYRKLFSAILTAVMLFPLSPGAAAFAEKDEQQTDAGILSIEVLDAKGNPLPGATIKIFKPAGEQIGSEYFTNERGKAEMVRVAPGPVKLQVEAQGYQTFSEQNIDVQGGVVTQISLQLSETVNITDAVEVKAESENLVERGSAPQGQLTQQTLKTVPLQSREFDAALPIIPGVIRGPDGKTSIKGRRESQNALLVNDADATDPATGNFALSIPLESIEKVSVYTNPYLPEYGKFTGGVTKVETKRGGEKFKIEVTDLFPEPRIRSGRLFGLTSFSPRLHLEGPIIKNRFFFSQGLEYGISKRPVRGLAAPNNETKKEIGRSFTQFDLIVSPRQTLTFIFNVSPRRFDHIGLDFFNPQQVAPNQKISDYAASVTNRMTLADGSFIEGTFQYKRIESRIFGEGGEPMLITPTGRDGNFFNTQKRSTERFQLRVTDTLPPFDASGFHNLKFGVDISYLRNDGFSANQFVTLLRNDGTIAQRINYENVGSLRATNAEISAFAQDQWLIRRNLSLDYGIRFEAQRATAGVSLMPRAAISYSPTASGNTVLRAAAGLFYDKVPLNALNFIQSPRQIVTRFSADGKVIDGPRFFDYRLAPRPNGKPNNGTDFAAPRNETFSLELNQRLNPNTLLKFAFLESRTQHDLYISPVSDALGDRIMLFNDGGGTYRSFEATANWKFWGERDMSISYIRSRARGELNELNGFLGDFPDPVIRANQFSNLLTDVPNRLLIRGNINKLPYGFSVNPLFDLHTGFPYSVQDEEQNFVGVRNSNRTRFPRFVSLDMAVAKDIRLLDKYNAQFIVSIFNVTNRNNPRNVRANLGDPDFGQFFARYRRFYRLDFAFTW